MKIAIISGTFPPLKCGVGDFVCNLSRSLAGKEVEVNVLTSSGVSRKPFQDAHAVTVWPIVRNWSFLGIIPIARRLFVLRPDAILFQYPTLVYGKRIGINVLPLLLKALFPSIRQAVTLHEFEQYGFLGKLRLVLNVIVARAVCVTTERERQAVLSMYPFARAKIHVVPIGSNIPTGGGKSLGVRLLKKLGVKKREKALVFFGWAGPGKGLPELFKAISILVREGIKAKLVCLSEFNPAKDLFHANLARLIRSFGVSENVTWAGFLPAGQVSSILKACDLCVLPFEDGLKMNRGSFTAALVNGARILTTYPSKGSVPAFVRNLPIGFTKPSAECLADAIKHALSVSGRLKVNRKRRPNLQMLSWERIAGNYMAVISR